MKPFLTGVLCLLLLAALSVFFYRDTVALFPSYIHAWTQADRYALALKFTDNGFNLFRPQTFNLMTKGGVTGVDLPLHEWFIALIMNASGSKEPIVFRLYMLCLGIIGCLFLYRLVKEQSGSVWKGMIAGVFVFSCPVLTYYQGGFIPSAASFSTALAGYYFYFRYHKSLVIKDLYWAISLLTAAALSRLPFNICLFAAFSGQGIIWLRQRKIEWREVLAFGAAFTVIAASNLYKLHLEKTYGSLFLNHLMAAASIGEFRELLRAIAERWTFQLFTPFHYALAGITFIFLIINLLKRKADFVTCQILLQSGLNIAGGSLYFTLMIRQFVDHEYYFTDTHYMAATLLLVAGLFCVPWHLNKQKYLWGTVLALLVAGGVWQSKAVQTKKYTERDWDVGEMTRRNFSGAAQLLDSLQITPSAKMLVIDAYSFNVPLILMNRMGHTVLSTGRKEIAEALQTDFDYIVVQDIFLPSEVISNYPELAHQLERVGGNRRISIFKYRPEGLARNLKTILGITNPQLESTLDFEPDRTAPFWKSELPIVPAGGSHAGLLEKNREFGPGLMLPLEQAGSRSVLFEGSFYTENQGNSINIVGSAEGGGKVHYYHSYAFTLRERAVWLTYQCLFEVPENIPPGSELKCYLWNPGGAKLRLDNLKVTFY